jgi:uncharacterized radical SAM superfamily protein
LINLTREEFIEKCKEEILQMASITEISFEECADQLYSFCNSYEDTDASLKQIKRDF